MSSGRVCEWITQLLGNAPGVDKSQRAPKSESTRRKWEYYSLSDTLGKNRGFLFRVHLSVLTITFSGCIYLLRVQYRARKSRATEPVQRPSVRRLVIHLRIHKSSTPPDRRCRLANEITEHGRWSLRCRMNERWLLEYRREHISVLVSVIFIHIIFLKFYKILLL